MSEIAIWQPGEVALPGQASGQVPNSQLDDWIMVADKVVRLAEVICRSPFVPDGLRGSVPATAAAILTGRELGIPPMTSLANIHVIHGKPGLSALVMRALVLSQGHEWMDVDVTNTRVVVKGRRKGEAEWTEASFSAADAATAKLALGGYPQDKLYARASARLARRKFADVIAGMPYSIEELEDGITDEESPAAIAAAAIPADSQPRPAGPRTAQRRKAAEPADRPTGAASATASAAASGRPAPAPGQTAPPADLPPLPGEEEDPTPAASSPAAPDPSPQRSEPSSATSPASSGGELDDRPGTVTTKQITAVWTILSKEFSFGSGEGDKDQARLVCAHVIGHDLSTTTMLSKREAGTIIDTLGHWQYQAEQSGMHPRDYMMQLLVAQDADGEVPGAE